MFKSLDEFVCANIHSVMYISPEASREACALTTFFGKNISSLEIFMHNFVFNNCVQVVERQVRNYSSMIVRLSPYEKNKERTTTTVWSKEDQRH